MGSGYNEQFGNLASRIDIREGADSWHRVPAWLAYFLSLGLSIASTHEDGRRVGIVLVPPVRAFAAVSAATAAVIGVAWRAQAVPAADQHFSMLAQLPLGTAVVVTMGDRIYSGRFAGVSDQGRGPGISVEYDGMTHYLPQRLSQRIQVGRGGKKSLPKNASRSNHSDYKTIAAIVGSETADGFLSVPTVDVVLVGQVALLSQELTAVSVRATSSEREGAPVRLAKLFRSGRFLPEGGISRSMLVSDRAEEFEMPVSDIPHVVVFDGVRAFARYRKRFPHSSWLVILDRCAPGLQEGAEIANEEFATRTGDFDLGTSATVPPGTEIQAFELR